MPTPVRRLVRQAASPQHLPVTLAVVVLLAFGPITTVLGLGAARAAQPCPLVWQVVLLGGPGFIVLVSLVATLRSLLVEPARAWVPAVVGSIACVLVVGLVSVHLHVA